MGRLQADPTNEDVMDMNLVQPLLNWAPNQSLRSADPITKRDTYLGMTAAVIPIMSIGVLRQAPTLLVRLRDDLLPEDFVLMIE